MVLGHKKPPKPDCGFLYSECEERTRLSAGRRKDMDSDRAVRNVKVWTREAHRCEDNMKAMLAALGDKLD